MNSVVTGLGVVSPTAVGVEEYWKASCTGARAIGRIRRYDPTGYPVSLAGEVDGLAVEHVLDPRIVVQTDRFTHFALAAAAMALDDAGLDPASLPPYAMGVVTASCSGGGEFGQRELERLWRDGPRHVGPYQSIAWFYAASTGQISIRHGLKGPCGVLVSDEAGGLDAIAHARGDLGRGAVAMLAGSTEAPLAPYSMACQYGTGLVSRATDADRAYQPFTAEACGFVPAEGGAMLVVEEPAAARRRGATPRAIVAGHASTFTGAYRFDRSAQGLAHAARLALAEAGRTPADVDVVFADALGVPAADRAEADALTALLGARARRVPVTAPKAGSGRAYAGAAALDTVAAVLTVHHGLIPPTPAAAPPAYDLDLVMGQPRSLAVETVLVLARGLAGTNSALVIRRPDF